jgi:D-beta-D-heptose 7-phosphate kinase / D-beta-D-heptose 1-phosphate adenosyltransferase
MPGSRQDPATSDWSRLGPHLERFAGAKVLCVGDAMLDRFVYGHCDRISPEAPIPVFSVERETTMLGGAGNVVRNLVALGAETCFVTVVGDDAAGRELTGLVADEARVEPYLLVEKARRTTIKTRFVASGQQMLRADRETVAPIRPATAHDLTARVTEALPDYRVLVLSDYGKGALGPDGTRRLIELARLSGAVVIVDPKGRDYARYCGASVVTPNRRELAEATGLPVDSPDAVIAAARRLMSGPEGVACTADAVLVTLSQDGMILVPRDGEPVAMAAQGREVFDVSGAGDTVVATLAVALAGGAPLADAAALANVAAGIVVGKVGTASCGVAEIAAALQIRELGVSETKVLGRTAAAALAAAWRAQGLRVGFTNGCFDLLHPGHVSLMAQARAACDRLIVGINADASVKRLKGADRPVQSETARAIVLASLAHVDAVTIFAEDTPLALIEALRPDILVKGADYTMDRVVGAKEVQSWGGHVLLADLQPGHSTTSTIKRMAG